MGRRRRGIHIEKEKKERGNKRKEYRENAQEKELKKRVCGVFSKQPLS